MTNYPVKRSECTQIVIATEQTFFASSQQKTLYQLYITGNIRYGEVKVFLTVLSMCTVFHEF